MPTPLDELPYRDRNSDTSLSRVDVIVTAAKVHSFIGDILNHAAGGDSIDYESARDTILEELSTQEIALFSEYSKEEIISFLKETRDSRSIDFLMAPAPELATLSDYNIENLADNLVHGLDMAAESIAAAQGAAATVAMADGIVMDDVTVDYGTDKNAGQERDPNHVTNTQGIT